MDFFGSSLLTPGKTPDFTRPLPGQMLYKPRPHGAKGTTASELLAAFSPRNQPYTMLKPFLPPLKPDITMNKGRGQRAKKKVTYTISDDSDGPGPFSGAESSFSTPRNVQRTHSVISLEDDDDDDDDDGIQEIGPSKALPPRQSSAGHSLRQHQDLHLSLRAQENGDRQNGRKRKRSQRDSKQKPRLVSDAPTAAAVIKSARNETRDFIATETARKRARFFVAKKEYFLPLLPEHNHIQRLAEQAEYSEDHDEAKHGVVSYETIDMQPKG